MLAQANIISTAPDGSVRTPVMLGGHPTDVVITLRCALPSIVAEHPLSRLTVTIVAVGGEALAGETLKLTIDPSDPALPTPLTRLDDGLMAWSAFDLAMARAADGRAAAARARHG